MKSVKLFRITLSLFLLLSVVMGLFFEQRGKAQTTAGVMPLPKMQFFANNGQPLANGFVYSYITGTSTPLSTYTDYTGGVANTNPVQLDSAGRANIWLGSSTYRIVLQDSNHNQIWLIDGVTAPTLGTGSIAVPNGQSFTMASGSTSSFSTALLPGAANTYNVGASGNAWQSAYINALNLNGTMAMATNNTYDIGAFGSAFRNIYASSGVQAPNVRVMDTGGLNANFYLSGTMNGTTNSFLTLTDAAGGLIWKWSRYESSTPTNNAVSYVNLVPSADDTYNLGSVSAGWANLFMGATSTINAGTAALVNASVSGHLIVSGGPGAKLQLNSSAYFQNNTTTFASLGSMGSSAAGVQVYCTDCTTAATCAGSGTGHMAVSNGSAWTCQ